MHSWLVSIWEKPAKGQKSKNDVENDAQLVE